MIHFTEKRTRIEVTGAKTPLLLDTVGAEDRLFVGGCASMKFDEQSTSVETDYLIERLQESVSRLGVKKGNTLYIPFETFEYVINDINMHGVRRTVTQHWLRARDNISINFKVPVEVVAKLHDMFGVKQVSSGRKSTNPMVIRESILRFLEYEEVNPFEVDTDDDQLPEDLNHNLD